MAILRRIIDWFKYERLQHYPALKAFDPPEALRRLRFYEREEREVNKAWLQTIWILIIALWLLWGVFSYFDTLANAFSFVLQIPAWIVQYVLYRRIRRRVEAKVAAELGDGRMWTCFECGYDLRASEMRCPECGTPVRVEKPTELPRHTSMAASLRGWITTGRAAKPDESGPLETASTKPPPA